ncbi:hypothetical protein HP439_13050 [Sphingobacterium shayense]|uniref:hypothetical protein n=1 Tax=Sphingobacterium shayense TaxID=626343 RepID=UPI001557F9E3|nr:hypothetical protein [Sphingobacterium shayense]NQD71650.1 hypothetical protein [Sphingobacterium shayense]
MLNLPQMILEQNERINMLQTGLGICICVILLLFLALIMTLARVKRYENIYESNDTENTK